MKLITQITLASVLGFALVGCGASGTKANLVDNFADDFETFKKQAAECEKVVFMSSRGGFERHPYHKELVQSYVDELQKLETQARAQGVSQSLKDKVDSIFDKMKEYRLDEMEEKKYSNTCFKLDNLYKMLQNQQEYDIYKERLNAKVVTFYFGSKEYQELKKELNIRAKKEENSKK